MAPKVIRRLPQTFPHKIVFLVSLVLCLCACASIVLGVVAWSKRLWGFYMGTGFWSGGIILFCGMFGIVASYIRNIYTVKTFMIISIFGCIGSLAMIALAAGGLDPQSGFYGGINKETFDTHLVHAVFLGIGVLQLTLCVLSDGICIYYLFIEKSAQLYRVADNETGKKPKGRKFKRTGKNRFSTASEAPLVDERQCLSNASKKTTKGCRKKPESTAEHNIAESEDGMPLPYSAAGSLDRAALRRQEIALQKSSSLRTPYCRSASFSTFGRVDGASDHASLIVHPTDDNASLADTVISRQIPDWRRDSDCHYAQTLLFEPPLPIEEDDELPPYEVVDSRLHRSARQKGMKHWKSEEFPPRGPKRRHSAPAREKKKENKKGRFSFSRPKIPKGRKDTLSHNDNDIERKSTGISDLLVSSDGQNVVVRLSRSADLSGQEYDLDNVDTASGSSVHEQGVACRNFAHSSDTILVLDHEVPMRHKRPHSLRVDRDKRLDRRRKALSAEVKLNKDQWMTQQRKPDYDSVLDRNSSEGLTANNRIMATKFSLRTPVRQIGMPHVCSPVPVKPIVDIPRITAPPKPPRSYSVTVEDLRDIDTEIDKEVEDVFADINGLSKAGIVHTEQSENISDNRGLFREEDVKTVKPCKDNVDKTKELRIEIFESDNSEKTLELRELNEDANSMIYPQQPEIKLDAGPTLKFVPQKTASTNTKKDNVNEDEGDLRVTETLPAEKCDTMTIPTSPVLKPPVCNKHLKAIMSKEIDSNKPNVEDNQSVSSSVKARETCNALMPFRRTESGNVALHNTLVDIDGTLPGAKPGDCGSVSTTSAITDRASSPKTSNTTHDIVFATDASFPASPTSPAARVQKAKRLTYSLTENDISVFDPTGDSKEQQAVFQIVDTISTKYPVDQPKESRSVEKVVSPASSDMHKKSSDSVTTSYTGKTLSNNGTPQSSELRVRLPPLSPSEKILQRKESRAEEQQNDKLQSRDDRLVILQPTFSPKDTSSGARPKTYKGLFAPLSPPKSTFERTFFLKTQPKMDSIEKDYSVAQETGKGQNHTNETPHSAIPPISRSTPPAKPSSVQTVAASGPAVSTSQRVQSTTVQISERSSSPPKTPSLSESGSDRLSGPISSATFPQGVSFTNAPLVPALPAPLPSETRAVVAPIPQPRLRWRRNSQGVRHLPQSQDFRQVSHNSPQADMQAAAALPLYQFGQQNHMHQNENNQTEGPLFSRLL